MTCQVFKYLASREGNFAIDTTVAERDAIFNHYNSCSECARWLDGLAHEEEKEMSKEQIKDAWARQMALRKSDTRDPETTH